jgi:tRNA (cmo5U34)-methyltransferase
VAINDAFNRTAAYYDEWIRKAVPGYDDLFAVAKELIPFRTDDPVEVLDLGAGTGLFSLQVLERCPRGRFVLWDVADKMLETARERFRNLPDQFRYVVDDYRNLPDTEGFDLVISSLSIHHLADEEKKELFRQIYGVLRHPGLFINIDLIRGPTPWLEELYCSDWYEKMRRAGAPEDEIRAGIERRAAYDRDALMEDQLGWLRDAGFTDADCVYRNYKMGLFLGMKRGVSGYSTRTQGMFSVG